MRPPPGYPFEGELPSRTLEGANGGADTESARTLRVAFVLAFAGAMMGAGFMLAAIVATRAHHAASPDEAMASVFREPVTLGMPAAAPSAGSSSTMLDSPLDSPAPSGSAVPLPPSFERKVPAFPARFLEGCSSADLDALDRMLSRAISRGAPLYNDGDIEGCADIYEAVAFELVTKLPAGCTGPVQVLAEGRAKSTALSLPSARAWTMRDVFDGLISIMDQNRTSGVTNL